jgi:UDPglucose 6-dehydrogenase
MPNWHATALTPWQDKFKDLDYERIYKSMAKPAFMLDGQNILDHATLRKVGFEVHAIGKPDPNKFLDL